MNTNDFNDETMDYLESLAGGPLTLGSLLVAIRESEELTQVNFASISFRVNRKMIYSTS